MVFNLTDFDQYKEDNRREVKKAKGGLPISLWETYSSYANCSGGVIILGVVENEDGSWKTTGLENPRKLLKDFWDTINNKTKVSKNLLTDLINIGERAGSGVPDIYAVWENEGWSQPIVEEQYGPDRTILTLPLVKKAPIKKCR